MQNTFLPKRKHSRFFVDDFVIWKFSFQVAWIKSDTKAILAIHDHVITNNARLDITHNDKVTVEQNSKKTNSQTNPIKSPIPCLKDTWTLTLKNVQTGDRGPYMCQVKSYSLLMFTSHSYSVSKRVLKSHSYSVSKSVLKFSQKKIFLLRWTQPLSEVKWLTWRCNKS